MTLPDQYIDHGSQKDQIEQAGLSSKHIAAMVSSLFSGGKIDNLQLMSLVMSNS